MTPGFIVEYRKGTAWMVARPANRDTQSAAYKKDVFWTSTPRTRNRAQFETKESAYRFAADVLARAKEIWGDDVDVRVVDRKEEFLK